MAWEGNILENVWPCPCPCPLDIRNTGEVESCIESPYPEQAAEGKQRKAEFGRPEISDLGLAVPPATHGNGLSPLQASGS